MPLTLLSFRDGSGGIEYRDGSGGIEYFKKNEPQESRAKLTNSNKRNSAVSLKKYPRWESTEIIGN